MNKDKIIGLSNRLNSIVDEANRHPNGTPGPITWDKAVYAIEALSKEANSKIIMPKVFDKWYKEYGSIDNFMFQFVDAYQGNFSSGVDGDLFKWIYYADNSIYDVGDSSIYNMERLDKCVNAIMSGDYEVEDDE